MGTAIQFAVRDGAGAVQHGSVAGEGQNSVIQVGSGDSVSLNVSRGNIVGYEQHGSDLLVKLADGRTITLTGYFETAAGETNHLFLSHDDQIAEVIIRDGGNGALFADYGPVQGFEKWSPLDNLKFSEADPLVTGYVDTTPAGMAPLIPGLLGFGGGLGAAGAAAAVVGGAAIIGSGGGSSSSDDTGTDGGSGSGNGDGTGTDGGTEGGGGTGNGGDTGNGADTGTDTGGGTDNGGGTETGGGTDGGERAQPTVDPRDRTTLTTNTQDPSISVTGTGEPGDTVTVTIGDKTETTTITEDGTWSVTFPETNLPADGDYTAGVVVTTPDGDVTLTGPDTFIDMTPPDVAITEGAKSTGDIENAVEYTDGVSITGSGEPGASIVVEVSGSSQSTTVGADGSWTVTFTTEQVISGEYETGIKVTATDASGNATVITDTLVVDTVPNTVTFDSVTADNTVNLTESSGVLTLTGQATAGAVLTFTLAGNAQTVTAGSDGSWSASWPAGTVAAGTYASTVTVTTTDAAGNTTSSSHDFNVDTQNAVSITSPVAGDDIVSLSESTAGVTLTGTGEPGSAISVVWNGATVTTTVAASGSWSATYATVAGGTYSATATVTSTDAAGNVATASHAVAVDTEVVPFTQGTIPTGGDGVINKVESAAGLTISGTVEAGSTVKVTFGSYGTYDATVTGTTWTVAIPAGSVPQGAGSTVAITAVATDSVGNSATLTSSVRTDTLVENFTLTGTIGGDGYINAAERAAGVAISGTVEAGSTVVIDLGNGHSVTATAGSDGKWAATIPTADLPTGDGSTLTVAITATDLAGNVSDTISQSVVIDTVAPDAPDVSEISRDAGGMTGIFADIDGAGVTFHQVTSDGTASGLGSTKTELGADDLFRFDSSVADGSYLVIENSDVAGNSASTLFIVNNTNTVTVDLDRAGLADFDFSKIDLTLAPQANLTITEAQLKAITGEDHSLTIAGGSDDSVTLVGGVQTGTTSVGGEDYAIYTLGTGGTVLVDDDIHTTTTVI